jgi:hypothetical protein
MLIRMVSPVKRPGSANHYFVQRIPADVRKQAEGLTLNIALGAETVRVVVSSKTESIKFSLRTGNKAEVRIRQSPSSRLSGDRLAGASDLPAHPPHPPAGHGTCGRTIPSTGEWRGDRADHFNHPGAPRLAP